MLPESATTFPRTDRSDLYLQGALSAAATLFGGAATLMGLAKLGRGQTLSPMEGAGMVVGAGGVVWGMQTLQVVRTEWVNRDMIDDVMGVNEAVLKTMLP